VAKHGKRYQEAAKLVDRGATYEPLQAMELVKQMAKAKFDETVEVAVRLGVDPKKQDQNVRGVVVLPHGRAKPDACSFSPRAKRRRKRKRPAPITSATKT